MKKTTSVQIISPGKGLTRSLELSAFAAANTNAPITCR